MNETSEEKCPKCGADFSRTITEPDSNSEYWECHSYRRTFHDETVYFTVSSLCEVRTLKATVAALTEKLEAVSRERDEAAPFMEAVKRAHNGYDAEAREVMPTLSEPATPKQAITELLEERDSEVDELCKQLAAANKEVERLKERDQQWQENAFISLSQAEAVGADKAAAMFRVLLSTMEIEEPPCQTE